MLAFFAATSLLAQTAPTPASSYLEVVASNAAGSFNTNKWDVWLTNLTNTLGINVIPMLNSSNAVVYQTNTVMNLIFEIIGGSNGVAYDVFATPALTEPNSNGMWSWMGQGYPGVTYSLPALTNQAVYLLLGTPDDPDSDGLTVAYERLVSHSNPYSNSINPAKLNGWAVLRELDPFAIYDQSEFPDCPQVRLGYWRFNNTNNWTNQAGVYPTSSNGLNPGNSFSGTAVSLTGTGDSSQLAYPITANGLNDLDVANGTVRFWYQPNWSSIGANAPLQGVQWGNVFIEVGFSATNSWQFSEWNTTANTSYFTLSSHSGQYSQPCSFSTPDVNLGGNSGAPVNFQSNLWMQIVLTYSPTNVAIYTNGVLLATANTPPTSNNAPIFGVGNGNLYYPTISSIDPDFSFGCEANQSVPVMGQLDELETFNYPLTAQQVAAGFPYFGGNATNMEDTFYLGCSDMLQTYVYGFPNPASTNMVPPCRLGYWRFDSPLLYAEQGQMPLSWSDVGLAPSWSGTALVITSDPASHITYPDAGSNGWANVNCRQGSVRFWFRPDITGGPGHNAPFVYMGTTNCSQEWALWLNAGGTSISFITATNGGGTNTNLTASCNLTNTHWTQIVLTYGSNGSSLYTNGSLAANGTAVTNWPSLTSRHLGMVLGNNLSHNASINGQFEEMETFNYQLAASNIASNFQIVASVDSDLDGIPDVLEDIHLTTNRPFLGAPVVITGTIEAEQFDMGGPGVGYSNTVVHPNNSYRPTGLFINTNNDLGGGYCLDQMVFNEWAQYTINVLVSQTYMVAVRAEAIGTNTGGVFECEFSTNGTFYTNTGPLMITSNNWINVTNVVYLRSGINVMKLRCLTNAPSSANVGRFNYISVYPYWAPPTNGPGSNYVNPACLMSGSNYFAASNNAYIIQTNVNNLSANGGIVQIPAGTWYVSQAYPNDENAAPSNAAVAIIGNNIAIAGEGTNNTFLIAHNRATTVFSLGIRILNGIPISTQCTNFTLRDLTLEAQPHEVAYRNSLLGYTNSYELGQLQLTTSAQGTIAVLYGIAPNRCSYNILISNCIFLHGVKSLVVNYPGVSNLMVQACEFIPWDINSFFLNATNNTPTNTSNTVPWQNEDCGMFGGVVNAVIVDNTYIGNSALIGSPANNLSTVAPDGFIYLQQGGNIFVAGNTISNYFLEGVQLSSGPNSIVGNTFGTLASDESCCALDVSDAWPGVTGSLHDYATCFIGNSIYGGRQGAEGTPNRPYTLNVSGNSLELYPAFDQAGDYPGAAVGVYNCLAANVCGNTLTSGGHGFVFEGGCSNALILNNNFAGATYRGIGYGLGGGYLNTAQVFGNILGQGVGFHVQLPFSNSFGWFLGKNTYVNATNESVPPFMDPASSAVHISN